MPRINALNILLESDGKEYLAELYGKTIEGVQKALISGSMKNMDLSGDPVSGTVEAKRFVNATPQKLRHRAYRRQGRRREGKARHCRHRH